VLSLEPGASCAVLILVAGFSFGMFSDVRRFVYFNLRHGVRGLRPKDEKECRKVGTVTAAKETRKQEQ
jgi:hypothetical protein